jgi:hypothetical protein
MAPITDEYHDFRVSELLAANNREVERRRAAEKALAFYANPDSYELRDIRDVPPEEMDKANTGWWPAGKYAPVVMTEGGAWARAVLQ